MINDSLIDSLCIIILPFSQQLEYLGLNGNLISDKGLSKLLDTIKEFSKLTSLNIASI